MKYSMFIGRWQPWHEGHRWLIDQVKSVEEIINETIVEFNQTVSRLNESKFNE